jgi:hypothetical protein
MWDPKPQSIIKAAETAAEAGNYRSAEHLLREAARLQEANLGPRHPDLANTLNNLGIVCEITGKPADAEQYFRRAVSIARTSLPPDHPFVTTSQNNLRDFCESRGKHVEPPAPQEEPKPAPNVAASEKPEVTLVAEPTPAAEAALFVEATSVAETTPDQPQQLDAEAAIAVEPPAQLPNEPDSESPEVTSRKFFYRMAFGALGPIAMLMVVLAAGLPRLGAPELGMLSREVTNDSPQTLPPPPPAAPTAAPAPIDALPAREGTNTTTAPTPGGRDVDGAAEPASDITPAAAPGRPVVVRASLCGDLDDWACDPADRPVPPGPLFFYTQVKSPTATTIQHRWYQDNHLRQAVDLRVEANRSDGYRTYSRNVMKSESAGAWRVEVRSQDGALLHEERFAVR